MSLHFPTPLLLATTILLSASMSLTEILHISDIICLSVFGLFRLALCPLDCVKWQDFKKDSLFLKVQYI